VVYGTPSAFVDVAPGRGYAVAPGVWMLLHQAAEQFRLMTGRPAPLEAMRAAVGPVLA
jgi:shikimate dehydrogenase